MPAPTTTASKSSFLFNVVFSLQDNKTEFVPPRAHLLETGQIGDVVRVFDATFFGAIEGFHPSSRGISIANKIRPLSRPPHIELLFFCPFGSVFLAMAIVEVG